MTSKRTNKNNLWIGGIVGFLFGICGNLVAAWIQQDLLNNSFTPLRIGLIILCALIGIVIMTILEAKKNRLTKRDKSNNVTSKNFYSRIRLAWSKFRIRGKGIHAEDISAVGSDIDIDAK
jgi:hypothetical protein